MENNIWLLKKLKIGLPYEPAVKLLGIYLDKIITLKDICTPMFIIALFMMEKTWKNPKCLSTDEEIQRCGIYTDNGILLCY